SACGLLAVEGPQVEIDGRGQTSLSECSRQLLVQHPSGGGKEVDRFLGQELVEGRAYRFEAVPECRGRDNGRQRTHLSSGPNQQLNQQARFDVWRRPGHSGEERLNG